MAGAKRLVRASGSGVSGGDNIRDGDSAVRILAMCALTVLLMA